jgi:hypothetical protein
MAMSPHSPPVPGQDLPEEGTDREIDIEQARRLLEALERELKELPGDRANFAVLEAEVAELRRVLHAEDATPEQLHTGLHGMRDRLHDFPDELKGDAFRAGRYLAELGRILGLG